MSDVRSLRLAGKLRLAAEIVTTYTRVRWTMRRHEFAGVVSILRRPPRATWIARLLPNGRADGRRLGAAVVLTLERLPLVDSRCLMRSLVLLRMLARRGVAGNLVIAVRPQEDLTLDAHAWVEIDGQPYLVPAGVDWGRLLTL